MKLAGRLLALLILAGSLVRAADPPPADSPAPASKHKLGGGFKGQPVAPAKPGEAPPKPTPPPTREVSKEKTPRIVIDNSRVKKSQPPASREAAPPREPPPPASAVVMPKIVDLQGHDETYWRGKAASVREAVARARESAAAAEAEEKRQENDFYAWDDGQYRDSVIKPAWDRAKDETVKARQELEDAEKQLEGLGDEARRAGAYPGWIREGPGR